MAEKCPPWLQHLDKLDDRDRYTEMSPEERLRIFAEVCDVADAILTGRCDRAEVLSRTDPMPHEAEQTWLRLVAESMRERESQ